MEFSGTSDNYERNLAVLKGLPDVATAGPSTIQSVSFIGESQTFIVTTYRQTGQGDTFFLEVINAAGGFRTIIPAKVAEAIARHRDTLSFKVRRKIGKANAEARRERGELPGFMDPTTGKPKRRAGRRKKK